MDTTKRRGRFTKTILATVIFCIAYTGILLPAWAAKYPSRPIHIVVPFDAGGGQDLAARILAQAMTERMNETVLVDNKPGAAGTLGADYVAQSAPDGYTLMLGNEQNAAQESVYATLPYDFGKDFRGISTVLTQPYFIAVVASSPFKTLQDLIAVGKDPTKKIRYGTAGVGTMSHLGTEMFNMETGTKLVHVPYRSTPEALRGLLTGEIQVSLLPALDALANMKAGSIRLLAVSSPQRLPAAPDIPTVAELGYPNYSVDIWFALLAPAKTPDAIVDALNKQVVAIIADPKVQKRLASLAATPMTDSPAELDALIKSDIAKFAAVVKAAGIKPQ